MSQLNKLSDPIDTEEAICPGNRLSGDPDDDDRNKQPMTAGRNQYPNLLLTQTASSLHTPTSEKRGSGSGLGRGRGARNRGGASSVSQAGGRSRKSIPLTLQYTNAPGSCRLVLGGASCPTPCNGACLIAATFLCAFGLTDSPWMARVSAERDDGAWQQMLCAIAIAVKFGVNQWAVIPTVVEAGRERLATLLPPTQTPAATEELVAALLGPPPDGCWVVAGGCPQIEGQDLLIFPVHRGEPPPVEVEVEGGGGAAGEKRGKAERPHEGPAVAYGLWSGLLRSPQSCHWAAFLVVPRPGDPNHHSFLMVEPGKRPTDCWLEDDLPPLAAEVRFFYSTAQYRHLAPN